MDITSSSFKYKDMRTRRNKYTINETAQSEPSPEQPQIEYVNPIGIYGWRKRFLYCLVLLLIVIVLVNLALTVWILVVLNFNIDGMGKLRLTDDGVRLEGVAEFVEPIITSNITSDENSRLQLQSHQNISITARDSSIELGPSDIRITADQFNVMSGSNQQTTLLSVTEQELTVQSELLRAGGAQGVTFNGAVTTGEVRADDGGQLRVEGGTLHLTGATGAILRAENGPVDILAAEKLVLSSQTVSLAGDVITLEGLPTRQPAGAGEETVEGVYQVCSCPSGQLVLVPAASGNGCSLPADACST